MNIQFAGGTGSGTDLSAITGVPMANGAGAATQAKANEIEAPLYAADAGSTDSYVIALTPTISSYFTGAHYRFKANTVNTGAATLNIDGLGAKTIKKVAGGITTDLATNDIRAGQWVDVVYDGTNFQMQSLLGNAPGAGSGTVTASGGSLTANALVLGAGTTDTAVVAGLTTDGISKLTLGVAGASVGSVAFKNATSGTLTLSPATGALGTVTLTLPAATDTLVGRATTDTLTNKRVTQRVETLTDAATVTIATDANDGGVLTSLSQPTVFGAPTGTPTNFQPYYMEITSSTARAISFNAAFDDSTDQPFPIATTGGGSTDLLIFRYSTQKGKWLLAGKNFGF